MTGPPEDKLPDDFGENRSSPTTMQNKRSSDQSGYKASVNSFRVEKLSPKTPHNSSTPPKAIPSSHLPDSQLQSPPQLNPLGYNGFNYMNTALQGSPPLNLAGIPPLQLQGIPYPYASSASPVLGQGNWMPVVMPTGQTVYAWVPGVPQATNLHLLHTGPLQIPPQSTQHTAIPQVHAAENSQPTLIQPKPILAQRPSAQPSSPRRVSSPGLQRPSQTASAQSTNSQNTNSQNTNSQKIKDQATLDLEFHQHNLERIRLRNELRKAKNNSEAMKAAKQRALRKREREHQLRVKAVKEAARLRQQVSDKKQTNPAESEPEPTDIGEDSNVDTIESSDKQTPNNNNDNDTDTTECASKGPFLVGRVKKLRYGHGILIPETQQHQSSITEKDKETALSLLQSSYKAYVQRNPAKPDLPEVPLDSVSLLTKFAVSTEPEAKMLAYKEIDVDNTAQRLEFNDLVDSLEMLGIQNNEGEWVCPLCPPGAPTFTLYKHLLRHATSHLNLQPFRCPFCFKKFRRSDTARRHQGRCFQLALAIDKRLGRLAHPESQTIEPVKRTPEPGKDEQVPALNDTTDYTTETEPSEDELREFSVSMNSPSTRGGGGESKVPKQRASNTERPSTIGNDRRNPEELPPVVMPIK